MNLRQATTADHEGIWDLLRPVFRLGETYGVPRDITQQAALKMWCELPAATYVAEADGRLLGTYYIKTNAAGGGSHVCNCGYVTDEAARGRGIAGQMCRHSQQVAQQLGYKAMQFNLVLSSNIGAIALWHKLQFETVGILPKVFDHPAQGLVDAHVMYKWLAD